MTVFNTGYATIEEAWGDITKKKKKKSQQDPICDLYEMKGNSSAYSETDLVNYAYDKTKSQRPVKDRPVKKHVEYDYDQDHEQEQSHVPSSLFEKQFEIRHPQNFDVDDPKEYMVKSCSKESPVRQEREREREHSPERYTETPRVYSEAKHVYQETDDDDDYTPPTRQERRVRQERPRSRTYMETDDEAYDDYNHAPKKRNKFVYIDLILYILY